MQQRAFTDIRQILEEITPQTVLLIDLADTRWFADIQNSLPECTLSILDNADNLIHKVEGCGQHDIAILQNTLEYLPHNLAENLISRLRDLYSRRILALVAINSDNTNHSSHWKDADLIALGMNHLTAYGDSKHLYEFNILNYKTVPDWLNAKNWANPELWGKHRW